MNAMNDNLSLLRSADFLIFGNISFSNLSQKTLNKLSNSQQCVDDVFGGKHYYGYVPKRNHLVSRFEPRA